MDGRRMELDGAGDLADAQWPRLRGEDREDRDRALDGADTSAEALLFLDLFHI